MINIDLEIKQITKEIVSLRHLLHKNAELGNKEYNTKKIILEYLKNKNVVVEEFFNTCLVVTLKGKKEAVSKTFAYRTDMDALPIEEETSSTFASINDNVMHACGHDIHMSVALGMISVLEKNIDEFAHTIKFIFEADEENSGNAKNLINKNVLQDIDEVYGMHVDPNLKEGLIGIKYAEFYATSDMFYVEVKGLASHGATPNKGKDALLAACNMVVELKNNKFNVDTNYVISVCEFNSGKAINVISDYTKFSGIIRTYGTENRQKIKKEFEKIIYDIANKFNVQCNVNFIESYNGIVNTNCIVRKIENIITNSNIEYEIIKEPLLTTEDFGYYIDAAKSGGAFYHLGVGGSYPLHNSKFLPNDDVIPYGIKMGLAIFLGGQNNEI